MTRLTLGLALLAIAVPGCARPYAGPRTLAVLGTALLLSGSAAWVAGERSGHRALTIPGFTATIIGAGAIVGAGGWLASTAACRADPDCAEGESCKEVPAPPGAIPYRQCMRR
jgi:hypothetical protein